MADIPSNTAPRRSGVLFSERLAAAPWWLIIIILVGAATLYSMLQEQRYVDALSYLLQGVVVTIRISIISYALALVLGLIAGLGRVLPSRILYTISTVYVEVIRGVPLFVIILYTQFVVAPSLGFNRQPEISGIVALAVGYGAYLAEVYRAGIESIERGQMEAGRTLGMSYAKTMRYIILPQAIRRVLPPLGNDFIALLKDSSLVSAIAVNELTKLAQIQGSRTFDFFRAFNAAAILYLFLTLLLSLGVRYIERRSSGGR